MASKVISKRSDPIVHRLRDIRDGNADGQVFCEGERIVAELLASSWRPSAVYVSEKISARASALLKNKPHVPVYVLASAVMDYCSDLTTPPGIICTATAPKQEPFARSNYQGGLVLVLDDVQLPQNVGALLRSAEAAGVERVFVTESSAHPWGPKSIRGSVGSVFRLPVHRLKTLHEIVTALKSADVKLFAATQNGQKRYDQADWRGPRALVVGSEGRGFTKQELNLMDQTVVIPMMGKVESLNAGIAAAVCLFEAARQRRADES